MEKKKRWSLTYSIDFKLGNNEVFILSLIPTAVSTGSFHTVYVHYHVSKTDLKMITHMEMV